ncbi:MAG: autotransporter outer membrane beta-barrel domain-containing protein, partial [Arenimonas sp.]
IVPTDATGQALTVFNLGPTPGAQTVSASVPGGASVTFTATATIARTLVLVSGDAQLAAAGATLPSPLVVHAQDDGVDAVDVGIDWSLVTGTASIAASGPTDAAGLASASVTLGATPGAVSIRAERADDPTVFVVFTASTAKIQDIPGLTPEERDLAIVIDETCASLAALGSLSPPQQDFLARCQDLTNGSIIDPGAVRDALEELMPGGVLALTESAFVAAQAQFQNLKARIAALRSGTQGSSFQGLALNGPGGTVSLGGLAAALTANADDSPSGDVGGGFQRWGFFASGTIGRGEAEEGSTRPAYDYDINGLTVGLDYRHSDTFIFGGALGYTRQDSELRGGAEGEMDMSGWSVSGYATWYRDNSWYTDAVLTWGRNSFDLLRSITYTVPIPGGSSTIIQTARSQSDGDLLEGAFTFGRDFQAGGWSIGPYGRLLYTRLDFERIVDELEPGVGSGLGLSIDARSLTSVASEIGAKFTYAHSTDWGVVTPHLQVEWEHEFKDDLWTVQEAFAGAPAGGTFRTVGTGYADDFLNVGAAVAFDISGRVDAVIGYEGHFSSDEHNNAITGRVNLHW